MLKKMLVVTGGAMLLLALFFGRDAYSYVSTSVDWVRQSAKNSVPVEFEIERARKMIKDLTTPIKDAKVSITREVVAVKHLQDRLDKTDALLVKNLNDIQRLRHDLDQGTTTFVYAGRSYSETQVKSDLEKRFKIYKRKSDTADKLRQVVEARLRGIEASNEKLNSMVMAKRQLEVDVENLEARQKMVEVAKASSKLTFDDSDLARTQSLIDEIGVRISVSEELVNSETNFTGQIQLDDTNTSNVLEEIDRYLDERGSSKVGTSVVLD